MSAPDLNAVVLQRMGVSPSLMVLRVAPDGWELPEFEPGQFAVLGLPQSAPRVAIADDDEAPAKGKLIRRAYSVASSSEEREYLEFYITLVRSGNLTPRLFALTPGDRIWLGPKITGTFTLANAPAEKNLLLVATGTGLAPYMSMLRTMLPEASGRRITVLLGARHSWDLGYHAELSSMQRLWPRLSYLPVVSRPDAEPVPWKGRTGYVTDRFEAGVIDELWGSPPTPGTCSVFLCGSPGMVDDMSRLLTDRGFREHSRKAPGELFVERYW